jgi:hypothetical protein
MPSYAVSVLTDNRHKMVMGHGPVRRIQCFLNSVRRSYWRRAKLNPVRSWLKRRGQKLWGRDRNENRCINGDAQPATQSITLTTQEKQRKWKTRPRLNQKPSRVRILPNRHSVTYPQNPNKSVECPDMSVYIPTHEGTGSYRRTCGPSGAVTRSVGAAMRGSVGFSD